MSMLIIDNNKNSAHIGFDMIQQTNESKLYIATNQFGFAVDVVAGKTYGNDAYFKVYQLKRGMFVKDRKGFFIASRIYYTTPKYFTHDRERDKTTLWNFSSKEKKAINDILKAPITTTFSPVKGFDASYIINDNITTYQYLIFVLDKLIRDINGFGNPTDLEIINSSIRTMPINAYFIPIDYPMPDYENMTLR